MKNTKKIFSSIRERLIKDRIKSISLDLNSSNAFTIAITFNELKRLKDKWHIQEAIRTLSYPEEVAVVAAIKYLVAISYPLDPRDVKPLLKRSERIKKEAINLFAHMDPQDGCKMLSMTIEDEALSVKIKSLKILEKIRCDEIIEKVKKLIDSQDALVKMEAIKALASVGEWVDPSRIVEIVENTKLPFNIRASAMKIFAAYFQGTLPLIKRLSKSTYSKISSTAILLMSKFPCNEIWESIKEILTDDSSVENIEAAIKSASISCKERKELEELILKYARYPSKSIKIATLRALVNLESQHAEEIIEEILEGNDRNLKLDIIPFVEDFPSKANVEFLLDQLENEDEELIERSLKVIGKLKIKDERIKNLLDRSNRIKLQALKALIACKDIEADELIDIFKNADFELKMEALNGIARLFPQRLEELA